MTEMNERISRIGVVPVIKLNHPEHDAAELGKALCAGGVPVAEVTFRAAGAEIAIKLMKEANPDMIVGAGTVTSTEQIDKVIEAGGEFIVSPGFDPELVAYAQKKNIPIPELVAYAQKKNIPIFPGCTTASEYHQALKFGLELIKFFPAEQSGGLAKIKALSAPFPMFKVMPTGGISLKNLKDYLSCPVIAACGGSYMVTADLIDNNKWDEITELCRKSREIVEEARS